MFSVFPGPELSDFAFGLTSVIAVFQRAVEREKVRISCSRSLKYLRSPLLERRYASLREKRIAANAQENRRLMVSSAPQMMDNSTRSSLHGDEGISL